MRITRRPGRPTHSPPLAPALSACLLWLALGIFLGPAWPAAGILVTLVLDVMERTDRPTP